MVPGTEESRSFSMANTPGREGRFEFVIKMYPDGLFSEYLADKLPVGDRLDVEGPFGTFTLRESQTRRSVFLGGGAGMAPCWACCGRWRSAAWTVRRSSTTGPAGSGTCASRKSSGAGEKIPGFRYVPALSDPPRTTNGTARRD